MVQDVLYHTTGGNTRGERDETAVPADDRGHRHHRHGVRKPSHVDGRTNVGYRSCSQAHHNQRRSHHPHQPPRGERLRPQQHADHFRSNVHRLRRQHARRQRHHDGLGVGLTTNPPTFRRRPINTTPRATLAGVALILYFIVLHTLHFVF